MTFKKLVFIALGAVAVFALGLTIVAFTTPPAVVSAYVPRSVIGLPPADILVDHTNEFGVSFYIRNTYGTRLYFRDDYRLYVDMHGHELDMAWSNVPLSAAIFHYIEPNEVQWFNVRWERGVPEGIYRFERDFFPNPDEETFIKMSFEFEIIHALCIPESDDRVTRRRQEWLDFIVAGEPSLHITASNIQATATSITFDYTNIADDYFFYGSPWYLARKNERQWSPVPYIIDSQSFVWTAEAIPIHAGETKTAAFNFTRRFGELPAGHYMLIREFFLTDTNTREFLMVDFFILEG